MVNLFFALLDVKKCQQAIERTPINESTILLGHYSINIASKYAANEEYSLLDNHWDEFEEALGHTMKVNDYDDLVVAYYTEE